jgi:hypothetical protein
MQKLRMFLYLTIIFNLIIIEICIAGANTDSLRVRAGEELVQKINLSAEDRVRITLSVLDQSSSGLDFWMIFPNATTRDYGEIRQAEIKFTSDVKGVCELHFNNGNSSESRLVTLNYDIEHYYFGIPEIPFLIIVIGVLLLCIIAGYIIMGKYS